MRHISEASLYASLYGVLVGAFDCVPLVCNDLTFRYRTGPRRSNGRVAIPVSFTHWL